MMPWIVGRVAYNIQTPQSSTTLGEGRGEPGPNGVRTGPADFGGTGARAIPAAQLYSPASEGSTGCRGHFPGGLLGISGSEPAADARRTCHGLAVSGGAESNHRSLSQKTARELQRDRR